MSRFIMLGTQQMSRLFDHHFGRGIAQNLRMLPVMYSMPKRHIVTGQVLRGLEEVKSDPNTFQLTLDVNQFQPEEISVKAVDNVLMVQGKHKEKLNKSGFVTREFTQRYVLPEGVEPEQLRSSLSSDGTLTWLTIAAPKKQVEERKHRELEIPIKLVTVKKQPVFEPPSAAPQLV